MNEPIALTGLSKTEQDYLKAIYHYQYQNQQAVVSLKSLNEDLNVSAATVTEMVKRLSKKDLINYESYKGVSLTEKGYHEARFIIKAHRVWELFLLKYLGFQEDEVHSEAENLEHASSAKLIERLWAHLNYEDTCPHGTEIPKESFYSSKRVRYTLDKAPLHLILMNKSNSLDISQFVFETTGLKEVNFIKKIKDYPDGSILVELNMHHHLVVPFIFQQLWTVDVYIS